MPEASHIFGKPEAGVIPGNVDVKKALDDLVDDRFVGAA